MVLDGKSSKEYPVNALDFFKGPFLLLHFSRVDNRIHQIHQFHQNRSASPYDGY